MKNEIQHRAHLHLQYLQKLTKEAPYHVLNGRLDPLNGITPNELNIKSLLERIAKDDIEEIILATNPNIEGETTAMYLAKLIKNFGIKITKLASGIPMGENLIKTLCKQKSFGKQHLKTVFLGVLPLHLPTLLIPTISI